MKTSGEEIMKRFLLVLTCSLLACSGCADESAKTDKTDWFFVNYTTYKHILHISINGKEHITIDSAASGFDSKPSPLREGSNRISLRFEQRPEEIGKPGMGSKARIFLSPTMMVGSKPLPGVEITEVDNYCECEIEVVMKKNVPQTFKYLRKDWVSSKKKIPLYEEDIEKVALSEVWEKQAYKSWTEEGAPFTEEVFIKGKLTTAKYYRPDGKTGAEVRDGKGIIREWYTDGTIAMEVPVLNGLQNGLMKKYSEEGKVISETNFKDGKEINSEQDNAPDKK
jgi:hypothetical protein